MTPPYETVRQITIFRCNPLLTVQRLVRNIIK